MTDQDELVLQFVHEALALRAAGGRTGLYDQLVAEVARLSRAAQAPPEAAEALDDEGPEVAGVGATAEGSAAREALDPVGFEDTVLADEAGWRGDDGGQTGPALSPARTTSISGLLNAAALAPRGSTAAAAAAAADFDATPRAQLAALLRALSLCAGAFDPVAHTRLASELWDVSFWLCGEAVRAELSRLLPRLAVAKAGAVQAVLLALIHSLGPPPALLAAKEAGAGGCQRVAEGASETGGAGGRGTSGGTGPGTTASGGGGGEGDGSRVPAWRPTRLEARAQAAVSRSIRRVLTLVPQASSRLLPMIRAGFPHRMRSTATHGLWLRGLRLVLESPQGVPLRDSTLAAMIEAAAALDAEIRWADVADAAADTTLDEATGADARDRDDPDIFQLEGLGEDDEGILIPGRGRGRGRGRGDDRDYDDKGDDDEDGGDDGGGGGFEGRGAAARRRWAEPAGARGGRDPAAATPERGLGPAAAASAAAAGQAPRLVPPAADSLDTVMEALVAHLRARQGEPGDAPRARRALLGAFLTTILPTHRTKFVQFLAFWAAAEEARGAAGPADGSSEVPPGAHLSPTRPPQLSEALRASLRSRATSPREPPLAAVAAAAYLSSYLARAASVRGSDAAGDVAELLAAAQAHLLRRTLNGARATPPAAALDAGFFAAVQGALYTACYRLRQWRREAAWGGRGHASGRPAAPPDGGDHASPRSPPADAAYARLAEALSETLPKLAASSLDPLSATARSVVLEFARQARRHGQPEAAAAVERWLVASSAAPHATRPLETFFPFDPYLLRRSAKAMALEDSYLSWRRGRSGRDGGATAGPAGGGRAGRAASDASAADSAASSLSSSPSSSSASSSASSSSSSSSSRSSSPSGSSSPPPPSPSAAPPGGRRAERASGPSEIPRRVGSESARGAAPAAWGREPAALGSEGSLGTRSTVGSSSSNEPPSPGTSAASSTSSSGEDSDRRMHLATGLPGSSLSDHGGAGVSPSMLGTSLMATSYGGSLAGASAPRAGPPPPFALRASFAAGAASGGSSPTVGFGGSFGSGATHSGTLIGSLGPPATVAGTLGAGRGGGSPAAAPPASVPGLSAFAGPQHWVERPAALLGGGGPGASEARADGFGGLAEPSRVGVTADALAMGPTPPSSQGPPALQIPPTPPTPTTDADAHGGGASGFAAHVAARRRPPLGPASLGGVKPMSFTD